MTAGKRIEPHIPFLTWQFQPVFICKCCSNIGNSNIEKQQLTILPKAATALKDTSLPALNCLKLFVHYHFEKPLL
jgi:hypothetical protein